MGLFQVTLSHSLPRNDPKQGHENQKCKQLFFGERERPLKPQITPQKEFLPTAVGGGRQDVEMDRSGDRKQPLH